MNERFYGNQVCCGTYACLNALQTSAIDPSLFELSVAAPFGIRHDRNPAFDRLLTTLYDPNMGLDSALSQWGYKVSLLYAASTEELLSILRNQCSGQGNFVLGPINMGGLGYQAAPNLLNQMDHYITLDCRSETELFYTDSEGIFSCRVNLKQLANWIDIDGLPEAQGRIALRRMIWERPWDKREILSVSLKKAAHQLKQAEEIGQGSRAVQACVEFLRIHNLFRWRLPFLYDLEYLHQRKGLFQLLLAELEAVKLQSGAKLLALKQMISKQRFLLSRTYMNLRWHNYLDEEALLQFGELEESLSEALGQLGDNREQGGNYNGGQDIGHTDCFRPNHIDTHAHDQNVAHQRDVTDRSFCDDGLDESCQ